MSLSSTIRMSLLDDLRQQLQGPPDAEAWGAGDDLYVSICLYLLARDGRHDRRHAGETERLFGDSTLNNRTTPISYASNGARWRASPPDIVRECALTRGPPRSCGRASPHWGTANCISYTCRVAR